MRKSTYKLIALLLTCILASSLGVMAFANETTIEFGSKPNAAPIAENLSLETFRGVAIAGNFKAMDPDGDPMTFEITAAPKKGSVAPVGGTKFIYTPNDNAKGKDSFTYVAVDSNGGVSANATVTISIKKQSTKTQYADMENNSACYAALVLSERGVFTGEKLGDEYFFRPDQTVSRGEFLAMCLKTVESEPIPGITRTGFYDDGEIPMWAKPYVSAALLSGIINGSADSEGNQVFAPNDSITFSEAAVIIDNTLGITDVVRVGSAFSDTVPVWAQSASANLVACNILPSGLAGIADQPVTRADAAEMLLASASLADSRDNSRSLLSWAR